jgi:hypothetical protein
LKVELLLLTFVAVGRQCKPRQSLFELYRGYSVVVACHGDMTAVRARPAPLVKPQFTLTRPAF